MGCLGLEEQYLHFLEQIPHFPPNTSKPQGKRKSYTDKKSVQGKLGYVRLQEQLKAFLSEHTMYILVKLRKNQPTFTHQLLTLPYHNLHCRILLRNFSFIFLSFAFFSLQKRQGIELYYFKLFYFFLFVFIKIAGVIL